MLRFWKPWEERWGALGRALELFRDFRGISRFCEPQTLEIPRTSRNLWISGFPGISIFWGSQNIEIPRKYRNLWISRFPGISRFRGSQNLEIFRKYRNSSRALPRAPQSSSQGSQNLKISKYLNNNCILIFLYFVVPKYKKYQNAARPTFVQTLSTNRALYLYMLMPKYLNRLGLPGGAPESAK